MRPDAAKTPPRPHSSSGAEEALLSLSISTRYYSAPLRFFSFSLSSVGARLSLRKHQRGAFSRAIYSSLLEDWPSLRSLFEEEGVTHSKTISFRGDLPPGFLRDQPNLPSRKNEQHLRTLSGSPPPKNRLSHRRRKLSKKRSNRGKCLLLAADNRGGKRTLKLPETGGKK